MSCFVVGSDHIDLLITAAMSGRSRSGAFRWYGRTAPDQERLAHLGTLEEENATEIGRMLWHENVESFYARYPRERRPPGADVSALYSFRRVWECVEPLVVLKAITCYEYQSCEHDGWDWSSAKAFCTALREKMVAMLPGYDAAPWEWSRPVPPRLDRPPPECA